MKVAKDKHLCPEHAEAWAAHSRNTDAPPGA